ncbi:hypothetical protein [Pseudomonas sp. zfem002]|uniref:hypothetical protein n=1 Tax=Pseudomonas sp. zfem002 TaxID=3078197 RepID=UPI0029288062|nr:hypothetical protein [Pseudomonas sp. zfem002]MDU9393969.1 hypothetical protein [Pseudomonas sp. zfem002]
MAVGTAACIFDGGTAGALDQSRVLCLADGEVVAYRIPTQTPTTRYFPIPNTPLDAPSASGFVLVRHRIQAPAIEGCDETPPALTFYSLYMHLQDWAAYEDRALERPAFWVESEAKWVKEGKDAPDINRKNQRGVWVAHRMTEWRILDFLPAGTQVEISGNGHYRELKGTLGPSSLLDENGALQGYVAAAYLGQRAGDMLEITRTLNVRAEPHAGGAVLGQLPARTLVEISGSGDFVKLERIEQYVPITALRSEYIPALRDQVFVPEKPIPIKAGELIGHIGPYQHAKDSQPRHKLHLEVFCTDYLPKFLYASRAWAERLPAKERTWLKIAKGSLAIIRKPEHGRRFPAFVEPHHVVDADLLVPKSLIDNLPAANKIHQPEPGGGKKRNWYYLEGLLNDEQGNIVDGWVAEIIGETPWVSPWHWDGYEVIHNSPSQTLGMAYRLSLDKKTSEEDLARLKPSADQWEQGELQSRLYAIIDRNRDRKLSTEEIRTALSIPAHAQALSRIVLECESEWYYRQEKWDALDQIFGHTTSAPILNWMAEKERIKALSWWGDVAQVLKFPMDAVHFLHPIGLFGHLSSIGPSTAVYYIYHDGLIERTPPADFETDKAGAHYIYIDSAGQKHDFGRFSGVKATRWIRSGLKGSEEVYLVDASSLGDNPARKFGFRFVDTQRRYLSQSALASLIGALMDVGYQDVASTGFSMSDGSSGVSKSHINGENGDFRFLRTDGDWRVPTHLNRIAGVNALDETRQAAFNNALYKFGWHTQLAWKYLKNGEYRLLSRTQHFPNHQHHLHVGKYSPNIRER